MQDLFGKIEDIIQDNLNRFIVQMMGEIEDVFPENSYTIFTDEEKNHYEEFVHETTHKFFGEYDLFIQFPGWLQKCKEEIENLKKRIN